MRKLILVIAVMLMMGSASAYVAWSPSIADPNVGAGHWNVATNWDLGYVPTTTDEVRFVNSLIPCLIDADTDAVCFQVKVGNNGGNDIQHVLTIKGNLTTYVTNSWSAAGYDRSGTINVERGGSFTSGYRLGIGLVAAANPALPSALNVNGGFVDINGNLQIGTVGGHKGIVNVKSGTLHVGGNLDFRDTDGATGGYWSLLDIRHGTLTVAGDEKAYADSLIANGSITGFGGLSTPIAVYADGVTTITATDPLTRSPKMDAVVPIGNVALSWKNVGTSPVYVAVYFGTDMDNLARITDPNTAINITTVTVNAPADDEYIWRVDTADSLPGTDPNDPIVGDTMYFIASSDLVPAVEMNTQPTVTWIAEPTPLQVTVKDDGKSAVTVTWTADDPNVVFTPASMVIPAQAGYTVTGIPAATSMTCDYQAGMVTVTATVSDGNPLGLTDSASVNVYVASTACAAARAADGKNLAVVYPGDINADCLHNLADFAVLAREWQINYTITAPQPDNR